MNTKKIIIWLTAILPAVCSCSEERPGSLHEAGSYRISLSASTDGIRSGTFSEQVGINDFNLYFFSEGALEKQTYVSGASETSVELDRYGEYTVYAIANAGKIQKRDGISEAAFLGSELEYSSLSSLSGVPCSYAAQKAIVPDRDIRDGLSISLTPMFARFLLSLEVTGGAPDGKLDIESVSCFNVNDRLSFFAEGDRASTVITEGDFLSAEDISGLTYGEEAMFFVPENMQGTKASSGHKRGSGGVCTFLVIEGTYESGAASYDLDYVLYLGKDSSTSFDIERGVTYEILASIDLGDEHLLGLTPSVLLDYSNPEQKAYVQPTVKYFRWLEDSIVLKPGESARAGFETNLAPSDISFSLSDDSSFSIGKADWESSSVTVTASQDIPQNASATLSGGSASIRSTMTLKTRTLILIPSVSEMVTWGGNSYPLEFTLADSGEEGTDVTSKVRCTSISYSSSAPSGLLEWEEGSVSATDWWGKDGFWAEAPVQFTMTFSLDGATATVTGTMNGYTGLEFDRTDYRYSELERNGYTCDSGTARLVGSETEDISDIARIVPDGEYMWDTNNGPSCVMVGNGIPASLTFTDPSNGRSREVPVSLNVSSDVMQLHVNIRPSIGGGASGQSASVEATTTRSGQYLGSAGIQYINYGEQQSYDLSIIQSIYYIDTEGRRIDLTGSYGVGSNYVRVETSIGEPDGQHDDYPDTDDWQMTTNLIRSVKRGQHDMVHLWVNGFSASWQWEIVN